MYRQIHKSVLKNLGFSLVEVLISAVILVGLTPVLMMAFSSAQQWIKPAPSLGTNVVRDQLEMLYNEVRADQWDLPNYPLSPGTRTTTPAKSTGYVGFTRTDDVKDLTAGKDYRKVKVTATWIS